MNQDTLYWVMLIGGALTFLTRLSFIALEGRYTAPESLKRALPLVPIAALSGLALPELLPAQLTLPGPDTSRLLAGTVAILVAWRWKNTGLTILAGFTVLFLLR